MNKHALQELLVSDGAIDLIATKLGDYLAENDSKVIKQIEEFVLSNPDYNDRQNFLKLDELIGNAIYSTKTYAFYLGVDYAFNLLGRDGVIDFLPESLKPEVEQ